MGAHPLVDAAAVAAALLADPAVAAHWEDDAVLPGYRVAGLAGHLARGVETTRTYLQGDPPAPDAATVDPAGYYAAVLGTDDPRDPGPDTRHAGVRVRGEERAGAGPAALAGEVDAAARWLAAADLDPDRRVAVLDGTAIRLGDYLDTRLVEVVVHADDLAVSVGLPTPAFDDAAWRRVADVLAATALLRRGPAAVALGLARPERGPASAFGV